MTTGRAVLGLATLVAVGLYTGTRGPGQVLVEEGWEKSSKNVVFAMCAVPIFMIGTWVLTSSGRRRGFTPFPTIGRILLMVATTLGPMTPIILTVTAAEPVQTTAIYVELGVAWLAGIAFLIWRRAGCFGYVLGVVLAPVLALAVLFAAIGWLVFYICCVAFWASRTSCWVGLFHPLLAPALSAILAVYFTIDAVITLNTGGVPTNLWLALTFGGAISTLLLAIIEHEMLRRRDGYSWRGGPEPITR
ncbi:MAG: hypothetical protein JWQ81_393 [Amycolatopsis sp.]|uniref:hypothetical protein n=1 Tax=Amycolatopsis sp. TaxID=37632 RepID=UPI00260A2180|nr:hypothetical protein [Amycolatopsis sp.]MCU1679654.1 hypothetical protein [Amycolatopsis sp.]